jgi:hypothetical protein
MVYTQEKRGGYVTDDEQREDSEFRKVVAWLLSDVAAHQMLNILADRYLSRNEGSLTAASRADREEYIRILMNAPCSCDPGRMGEGHDNLCPVRLRHEAQKGKS